MRPAFAASLVATVISFLVVCAEARKKLGLFEVAHVLVPLDHVASRIVNANHNIM